MRPYGYFLFISITDIEFEDASQVKQEVKGLFKPSQTELHGMNARVGSQEKREDAKAVSDNVH